MTDSPFSVAAGPGSPARGPGTAPHFPRARRGYEPAAVDEHLSTVEATVARLREELAESDRRRWVAEGRAGALQRQLVVLRDARPGWADGEASYGTRAEKLLRLAEQEAADVLAQAHRAAASVRHRAETETEQQLQHAERSLRQATERAEHEVAGWHETRDRVRSDLHRLRGLLGAELDRSVPEVRWADGAEPPGPEPGPEPPELTGDLPAPATADRPAENADDAENTDTTENTENTDDADYTGIEENAVSAEKSPGYEISETPETSATFAAGGRLESAGLGSSRTSEGGAEAAQARIEAPPAGRRP